MQNKTHTDDPAVNSAPVTGAHAENRESSGNHLVVAELDCWESCIVLIKACLGSPPSAD
jgi:hypothetical protein